MRSSIFFLLIFAAALLCSCNIPGTDREKSPENGKKLLWDLNIDENRTSEEVPLPTKTAVSATPTPQLIKAIDFESAFSRASIPADGPSAELQTGGDDAAQWAFFDPAEYSADPVETLYAAFDNTGTSVWAEDYYLEFFAGADPAESSRIRLNKAIQPGERGIFQIPITNGTPSWKSCWQLKNTEAKAFYEFCYNHGSGNNSGGNTTDVAAGVPGKQGYFAFQRTDGTAPAKYSSADQSAALLSTSPKSGHTFKAYDHFENFSVTFRNDGSASWNSAYNLVFYNGYNWFHETKFSLPGSVGPGESVTFTMPMEIIEDNDKWYTCWYLSTPDGKNLYDFCFNYYTKG